MFIELIYLRRNAAVSFIIIDKGTYVHSRWLDVVEFPITGVFESWRSKDGWFVEQFILRMDRWLLIVGRCILANERIAKTLSYICKLLHHLLSLHISLWNTSSLLRLNIKTIFEKFNWNITFINLVLLLYH